MPPPRDRQAAELLQVPLSYPGLEDQEEDILATGDAQAGPGKPQLPGGGGKPEPKDGRTLTEEQRVTADDLDYGIMLTPDGEKAPSGETVTVYARFKWTDSAGVTAEWDPSRVHMRYGSAEKKDGNGLFQFRPTYTTRTLVVEVDLWSEKRGGWKRHQFFKQDITAYCSADTTSLSSEELHVVATLFSEGGSDARNVTEDELARIMWCIENRLLLLVALDRALADNPSDTVAKNRKKFATSRGWGREPTYESVLSKTQFTGIGSDEYEKAKDPPNLIKSDDECQRLQLTMEVALGVMTGTIPNPDAGLGNSLAPGCFYYMTKKLYNENVRKIADKPELKDQLFAPDWDKLPSKDSEKHYYWGIEPRNAFKP